MRVCESSSNIKDYGFPELQPGQVIDDAIDFMIGMDVNTKLDLPFVASPNGMSISVSLVPCGDNLTVLISDVSDTTEQRRKLQQAANENELLVERQKKLMAELERASRKLEQKNRQLEEASRLQTSFLSGVSHEFRTPLTSIIGYTNLVLNNLQKTGDEQKGLADCNNDYLSAVQRSSKHLMSLVENLLDHGKLDSDEIVLKPKPNSLKQLIDDVELVLRPLSETKGIEFNVIPPYNETATVMVDDSRLRQCLINLIGNAIKFTDQGSVTVDFNYANDTLQVSILDTGIGISEEDMNKIRLPFYQASGTGKIGTGLGLTITERIINMMGGALDIFSELGEGTLVKFNVHASDLGSLDLDSATRELIKTKSLDILLAEDDPFIADLMILMLKDWNIDVTHVVNGALAVEAVQSHNFDLIIMDIHMPVMSGYEAVLELNRIGSTIPVIVMSASAVEADQKRAAELGCSAYLTKPVDVQEIIETADILLSQ